MNIRRSVLSLAVAMAVAAPVTAAEPTIEGAADRAMAMASGLEARAAEVRADLTSGRFERVVTRLATMAGLPEADAPTPPPAAADLAGLPPAVRGPVADLLAASALA
ncbi:MAG TPA: hypothetical protein VGB28_05685, partial [Actinomycetota bacterium]